MNKRQSQCSLLINKTANLPFIFIAFNLKKHGRSNSNAGLVVPVKCRLTGNKCLVKRRPVFLKLDKLNKPIFLQLNYLGIFGSKRGFTTAEFIILILVAALVAYLYVTNLKNRVLLKSRQEKIDRQDDQIKQNIAETTKQNTQLNNLLQEKEWLIKEVHHRVRNNLQIISSLLNTQSSYLENEEALKAIRDSQNRLQAIAIVHQKLYQSDELSTISLQVYIKELAQRILSSFQETTRIKFRVDLEQAQLDTDQIVPLGLIINEIITNSVKHAFPDQGPGIINLSSSISADSFYEIIIADNGIGLPDGFDAYNCHSLGMNLIIGLTKQLGGKFILHSTHGTQVYIAIPLSHIKIIT